MATSTPNLELIELQQVDLPAFLKFNNSLYKLDTIVQLSVLSRSVVDAPVDAAQGDRYIVPDTGLGDVFAGQARKVAYLSPTGWVFRSPRRGWISYVQDEDKYYSFKVTGEWEDLGLEALTVFTTTTDGLVPAPGSIHGKFLTDNGDWEAIDLNSLSDVVIASATDGQVLTYDAASGEFINADPTGGGGGGGTVYKDSVFLGGIPATSGSAGWPGYSIISRLRGRIDVMAFATTWKVQFTVAAVAAMLITKAVVLKTAAGSNAVVDSATITWSGVTAATLAIGSTISDEIALVLDRDHDYYMVLHFDAAASATGQIGNTSSPIPLGGPFSQFLFGDQTAVTSVVGFSSLTAQITGWTAAWRET